MQPSRADTAPAATAVGTPTPGPTPLRRISPKWLAALLIVSSALVAVALLAIQRGLTLDAGQRLTHSLASVVDEQTARTLQTIDQRLQLAAQALAAREAAGTLDHEAARTLLREQIEALPYVLSAWTLDRQGRVRYHSDQVSADVDQSVRDYFQIYRTRPGTDFYLSNPSRDTPSSPWKVSASRPLSGPDGQFNGAIAAAVDPLYFDRLWHALADEPGIAVSLLRTDGTMMLRSPVNDPAMGRNFSSGPLFKQHLPTRPTGGLDLTSPIDGSARFVAYRTLVNRSDLVILIGRTKQAMLAPWRSMAQLVFAAWVIASLAIAASAAYFSRLSRLRHIADQREAEMARRLTLASEASGIVVWDWNLQTEHYWATPTFYTSLGYPFEEGLVDLARWRALVHDDDRPRIDRLVANMRAGGQERYDYETRLRHADGSYRWVHVRGQAIAHDANGKPLRMIGVRTDITQRRQAEAERQQIYARITDGFVALDLQWRFIYANKQAGEILDCAPESLIGQEIWTRFPARAGETFHLVCRQAMLDQKPSRLEAFYPEFGRWIEDHIYPSPQGLSIYFRDITQRKLDEEALRNAKDYAENLIDGANAMVVGLDTSGEITLFNAAAERITGYTLADLKGRNWFETLVPRQRYPQVWEAFERLGEGAVPEQFENPVLTRSGEERLIAWRNSTVYQSGVVVGGLSFGIDVTDARRSEQALAQSEQRLRDLMDGLAETMFVGLTTPDGRIVEGNRAVRKVIGPNWTKLGGRTIDRFPGFSSVESNRRALRAAVARGAAGESSRFDLIFTSAAGDDLTIDVSTAPLRDAQGQVQNIVFAGVDITDRKKAETALRHSEAKYRQLVDSSPYAIAVHQDGLLVMVNQAALTLVGATDPQQVLGTSIFGRLEPERRAAAQERIQRLLAGEKDLYPVQDRFVRLDGSSMDVQVTAAPLVFQGRPAVQVIVLDITGQKQTEQALLESEARFRNAFDSSGIGMSMTALDGHWLRVNPALNKIVGYSVEEMRQTTFMDLTHPEDLAADLAHMDDMLAGRCTSFQMEKRYIHKDGHTVWINLTVALVRDADGRPLHTVAQMEDISQRKRLEAELRASQANLATTLDALPDLLFEVDIEGRYVDYHSPRTDLLMVPPDRFIGRLISDFMSPAATETVLAGLRETLATGRFGGLQIELDLPTGPHWFELTISRKPAMPGQNQRFIVLSRDVTERVQVVEALARSEERFREMAENVREAFWLGDFAENRMLYVSPAFETLTGVSVQSVMAEPQCWRTVLHPLDRERVMAVLDGLRANEGYDMEYRIVRPDGQLRWIHSRAAPIRDARGQVYRVAGVMDDITARKSLQLQDEVERTVLHFLTENRTLSEVLDHFVLAYASLLPGSRGSVLLMDADGVHIRHGAATQLPKAFCDAVDGQPIGPEAGSCGTAAFLGRTVVVADIDTDPLWQDYRELALSHGLHACWSVPIKSTQGAVVGTFAFYFNEPRDASAAERALIERGAQIASTAIERHRAVEQLQQGEERYRSLVQWTPLGIGVHQDGVIVYANPSCMAIFGALSESELLGRPILDFIQPQDHAEVNARIARILSGEHMPLVLRTYTRLDGRRILVEGKAAPISFNGKPAVQFSMRDVTAEKAAEADLLTSRQQLRVLSGRVLAAQETERRRIAHELHDELGQALTAIKINLQAAGRSRAGTAAVLQEENIRIVEQTLHHVRGLALALRPSMLDDLGLLPALRWLTEQQASRNELPIVLSAPSHLQRLSPDKETAVFRIVQEALTNIVRHAHATEVEVSLQVEVGALRVDIIDNGVGFDVPAMQQRAAEGASIGVLGMAERASVVGATLTIHSEPGRGCTIALVCPTGAMAS